MLALAASRHRRQVGELTKSRFRRIHRRLIGRYVACLPEPAWNFDQARSDQIRNQP